jgi:hypothetical protein
MAQANPFDQFDSQQAPVPIAQIRPVIAPPRDPYEADKEARAKAAADLAQQQADITARGEKRAIEQQGFSRVAELRKEFLGLPEVKDFRNVLNSTQQIMSLAKGEGSAMGDLAAIFSYMKTLDPGSTVREGEAASAQNAAGIPERVRNYYNNLISGERLSPEQRADMANTAITLYKSRAGNYNSLVGTYSGLLRSEGADPAANGVVPPPELAFEPQTGATPVALEAGATFSTEQDKAIRDATQQAWQSGADLQGIVAAAQAAGGKITPNDIANIQAAIEARAKGQSVTFNPAQTGQRSPVAQAAGEFLMTPAGTALTGAVNAAGAGLLSQVAGDQVQGLEALNPEAAFIGELGGAMLGTAGLAGGTSAALRMAAPGLAERVAGGGLAGAIGREALTESAYGGLYAANTGQDIGTGLAMGAAGSLGGRALGAAARRVAPAVGRMLGREGGNIPPDGGVPPGGTDMGGGVPPAGGMPPVGGTPAGTPSAGASMAGGIDQMAAQAEEPFAPVTFRSNDAGSAGTSPETMRMAQAQGLPVPVELTRGAATRDAEQLAFEKEQIFGELGGPLRRRAEENNLQALQNFDRLIDMTGAETPDIVATGNAVINALTTGYKAAKNRVNVAYKRADAAGETQEPVSYAEIVDYINQQPPTTVSQIAPILRTVSEQLRINDPDGTGMVRLRDLEEVRKLINKNTQYGTPNAAYGGELKGIIDQATEGKGGELYQQARKLRIEQARKFENRAIVSRLVSNIKNMDDPKVAADKVFKRSILDGSPEEIKFLRQTLRTSGASGRQAWSELQGATVRHLQEVATQGVNMTSENLPVISTAKLNQELGKLEKNGRLDVIFDPKMAQTLRDLNDVVRYVNTVPPGTSINNSGTARTLMAALGEMSATGLTTGIPVPLLTGLKVLKDSIRDAKIKAKIARSLMPKE